MSRPPRIVSVRGGRNFRDLGGYAGADGRRVRHGVIYRAGHPGELCEVGCAEFAALGIGAVVDLRTTEERAHIPYPDAALAGTHYWSRDYTLSHGDITAMLRDTATTGEAMRGQMRSNYRRIAEEQRAAIGAVFGFLAEGRTPVLINCTAGKDRTGVTVALVLAALGVSRDDIRHDYAYTEVVQDPGSTLFDYAADGPFAYMREVPPEVMRAMMGADPANIDVVFEELDSQFGGIEGYLAEAHGITGAALATIREMALEA